jgi:hypothetical protein
LILFKKKTIIKLKKKSTLKKKIKKIPNSSFFL